MAIAHDARPPVLADGVQLIGEYEGSGFKEPPSLVRRPDGQVIQLPPLLYSVASRADGSSDYERIAREVSDEIRRGVDAEQVRFLVEEKLRPLGIVAASDGSIADAVRSDPFLGLKFRMSVIPERVSNLLGAAFRPLFLPPVVLAVLAAFVATDVWLFGTHGVAQALRQSIENPAVFLALFGGVVLSAGFHEIGHAAACRYGGGRPGKMGCGIYLAWPAFYTDVTDAYRLAKRDRLRTDLGGVYFNVVVIVGVVGAYLVTGFEPLLLLAVVQHFEIAHQLLPVVRLDGYYIVADLTGVPDLFARIGPILRSALPWRRAEDEVRVLKPWVRVAVTAWVLAVVPLLLFQLLVLLVHLPRILATGWASGTRLWGTSSRAFAAGDPLTALTSVVQLVVLAIPIVGIALVLAKLGRAGTRWVWRTTSGRPLARAFATAAMAACAAALLAAWLPRGNYEPITPRERGTLVEGIGAVRRLPSGEGPLYSKRAAEQRAVRSGAVTGTDAPVTGASDATTTTAPGSPTTTTVLGSAPPPGGATGDRTTATTSGTATTSAPASTTSSTPPTTSTTSTTAPDGTTTTAP
jgi:putative peptide zinc metalloprotease protein